jgi:uncharacterized protein YbjT (DUF2867 family)
VRLLVTGGSGFLGEYVLREAEVRGHDVTALARSRAAAAKVGWLGARAVRGDLSRPDTLASAFDAARSEVLVSLASPGLGHTPAIVAATRAAGIPRAVFVSATALPAVSGQARLAAEQEIRESGLDWTILRPTTIYGALGDRNLSRLLALLRRMPVLPAPAHAGLHQPVHAGDVASAVLAAAERPGAIGSVYDVAGPDPLTFEEMVRTAARAAGRRARLVPVPLAPLVAAARGYELVSRHPRIRAGQVLRLTEDQACPIDAAVRDLGYAPRSFADGIAAEARALGLPAAGRQGDGRPGDTTWASRRDAARPGLRPRLRNEKREGACERRGKAVPEGPGG